MKFLTLLSALLISGASFASQINVSEAKQEAQNTTPAPQSRTNCESKKDKPQASLPTKIIVAIVVEDDITF